MTRRVNFKVIIKRPEVKGKPLKWLVKVNLETLNKTEMKMVSIENGSENMKVSVKYYEDSDLPSYLAYTFRNRGSSSIVSFIINKNLVNKSDHGQHKLVILINDPDFEEIKENVILDIDY